MKKKYKGLFVVLLAICLLIQPVGSAFADESPGEMAIDAVVYRPVGVVCIVLGAIIYVVSWPFAKVGGNSEEAFQNLIVWPATFTFNRKLGDI